MKAGKITEPQCVRSVLKWLPDPSPAVIRGAGIGQDYSTLLMNDITRQISAISVVTLPTEESEKYAFWKALNKVEASGAKARAMTVSVLLPARGGEERIRRITQKLAALCEQYAIDYLGGHTELLESLRAPAITITMYGVGADAPDEMTDTACPDDHCAGQDIVAIGNIAMETSMMILADHRQELESRYAASYLDEAAEKLQTLSLCDAYTKIRESAIPISYIHNLSTGGIYAGLWELGVACNCGIRVELKKIPILQETVEICEYYDINPYMTFSGGCALIVTKRGEDLEEFLKKHGFSAIKIGQITTGNDRIVCSGDNHSYLTHPKGDDCYKLYSI